MLKHLIAGAAGGTLGFLGIAPLARGNAAAPAAAAGKIWLPMVANSCTVASVCGGRQYCSSDQNCLCIESAEGSILCGQIPSCSAQLCKTSADCANLGTGYFCDAPQSGCCDSQQRCIAPCETPCPPERQCGDLCCPEGDSCVNGSCQQAGAGTMWEGTTSYSGESVGVRFMLEIDGGSLTGAMEVVDPKTQAFLDGGTVEGTVSGTSATWKTQADQDISGTFSGNSFTGTIRFPEVNDQPSFVANINLAKAAGAGGAATTNTARY